MAPRWNKVVRDVFARRGRSFLAVLAMAAGVFEIGAMLTKYALLQPELTGMYGRTNPASATLIVDHVSDALIDSVRRVPGVGAAEARPVVVARVLVGEEWVPALFHVVRDFDGQQIDTFEPDQGAWPPRNGELLLERTALQVAKVAIGDSLVVRLAGGDETKVRVAGTAYAAGMAPAWMEHMVPGFVSWTSPVRGEGESAQIRIVVADHPLDEGYIREVADSVRTMLELQGQTVSRITVPTPGKHPHADQMEAFLFLILTFGVLSFMLSSVLVAGMTHALMAEQVKQVGMMKAIGATSRQIAGLYLAQVSILAAAALALGIPLGLVAGRAYAQFAAGILNADVSRAPFPWGVVLFVIAIGLLVPLLVALGPVLRASRITVREALNDDPSPRPFGSRWIDRWLTGITWASRPLMISLRSTFVRPGRLALTVVMLAVGGASFMSAINVSRAWTRQVDREFERRRYDLTVTFASPTPIATLEDVIATVPGIVAAEYWSGATPWLIGASGVAGSTVSLVGPSAGSKLLDLPLVAGTWLRPGEANAAVINQAVVRRNATLGVGDSVRMRFQGRDLAMPIVGIVKELAPMPIVYAPREAVLAATGQPADKTRSIRIVTRQHDEEGPRAVARDLERAFAEQEIEVSGMHRMLDQRQGILDHLVIIMSILTVASLIVVFVGGLGLTSTLTLNVVQRTRELGILGAIGATPSILSRHVWFEGVLIGVLSWALANILAAPVSWGLEAATGSIFFKIPLDFYMSPTASAIWLGLVVVLASISSFVPARRAARLTVREALSHV